jgi:16S rRNA (adenine1518-N6/adenine1519-N6)-dimethyltransferase
MEVRAKKSLGQHFLTDLNIARKIAFSVSGGAAIANRRSFEASASDGVVQDDAIVANKVDVLEIGGGMGVLTQFLLERDDVDLWVIDIDRESVDYMRDHFPTLGARLIHGDFLKLDLHVFHENLTIVGNFPYNISSQIFFKVLENRDLVPEVVGMVQKEVAERIAEPPGSRSYGIMSVLLQAWYDIEYLFTVSESVFSPPPKVKSAVIRLTRNSTTRLGCDEALFVKVVKAAFGQRRKMIRNSLRAVFGDFGGAEHRFFTDRAEKLSVSQFVELTNWVAEHSK